MPQGDLETLNSVYSGGDQKIACERLADDGDSDQPSDNDEEEEKPDLPPDFPPESFWLSKDAEFDWFDRNAFLDRKDSAKGNSNSTNLNPNLNLNNLNTGSNSSSQRFSMNLKSKAKIIGLPKTQKTSYGVDTTKRRNCKAANTRLFPKRSESVGNKPVVEPSSPKVSCMGRVRSKRGRKKRSEPPVAAAKATGKDRSVEGRRARIYRRLMGIFRSRSRTDMPPSVESSMARGSWTVKSRELPVRDGPPPPTAEPPGLGGMTRFASGRKSASSWGGDD